MKHEFEQLTNTVISDEEYKIIEDVYMWYPKIETKATAADLYNIFGLIVFEDMHERALKIEKLEAEIQSKKVMLSNLRNRQL
jgi:hypothetical protein